MKLKYTTLEEKLLKSKNSQECDGIHLKIIKVSTPFVTSPLAYFCNKSLLSGIFPS